MVLSVALLSGLMVIGAAAPALAAPPTDSQNFYPDDTTLFGLSKIKLSDRFDGVDTTVHLTNVSTIDTTRVQWRLCPSGTVALNGQAFGGVVGDQARLASCTITIGEDATATTPAGNGVSTIDEAYAFNWDIPGSEDGGTRDLLALACIGAGEDVEGTDANCKGDIENDVLLDDAQTAVPQTTAGEMASFCTSDVGGPGAGNNPCTVGGLGAGTPAEVAARFQPFPHGSSVPNDGFVMRASTSEDVSGVVGVLGPGDAVTDPNQTFTATFACTNIFTGTNFKTWECQIAAAQIDDNAERYIEFYETGGSGNCLGDTGSFNQTTSTFCVPDVHYIVSGARTPTRAVAYFSPGTTSTDDTQAVNADSSCATPDKEDTNRVGNSSNVNGCIFDQFGTGNKLDTTVTFESTGVGGFDDCEGTRQDHDGDLVYEHCHVSSMGSDNEAGASIYSEVPGDQTVTFCFDAENTSPDDPAVVDHGCADETVKDTLTKHWIAGLPDQVRLVYAGTGQPSTNECFTGATFRENRVGETDDLLACVFDAFDNPVNTSDAGHGFLEWFIDSGNDDEVDTQYVGLPPSETGADGHATATIEAVSPGSDRPGVELRAENGDYVDDDSVTKNVVPGGGDDRTPSAISIRHRKHPHRFTGRVTSSDAACISGRNVVLKRVRRGPDRTIGTDATNAAGKYSIRHRKTRVAKRYYTKVRGTSTCGGARSRTLRRR